METMLSSSYSVKYKQLQRQHIEHLKDAKEEEKYATDARSKKLQFETCKRRKALAIRRKLDQAKEERRRQEILAKRREEIKSATERYQRLNKHYTPKSDAEIKASLLTVTGTPDLEDALQIVRGSPRPSSPNYGQHHYRQGSGGTIRSSVKSHHMLYSPNGSMYHTSLYQQPSDQSQAQSQHLSGSVRSSPQSNKPPLNHGPSPVNLSAQKQIQSANAEKLHDHSLRNMTNSRSLFEQQLEQQQRSNSENSHKSLHHFNSAVQKEVSGKESNKSPDLAIDRQSGSVTSMDSLEQTSATKAIPVGISVNQADYFSQRNTKPVDTTQTNSRSSPSIYGNSNFGVHRSSNSPTVAVVQPSVVRRSPPETQHGVASTADSRPYNKHNYDLNGESLAADNLQDSLEVNCKPPPSYGNPNEKSSINNFLETYDYRQPVYPGGPKGMYDGAAYQDVTVGYTNGVDFSYAKPGYNGGHSVSSQSQRSGGWAIPTTTEIGEVGKWNVPQSFGNNSIGNSSLMTTSKPLHSSHVQNGQNSESKYYLHTSNGPEVGAMSGTSSVTANTRPVKTSTQERPTENGHVYTSAHYTATNNAPTQNGSSSAYPTNAVGGISVPYPTIISASTPMPAVNGATYGPSPQNDNHQMYSAAGNYDVHNKPNQQASAEVNSNGRPQPTANVSYNASAYSTAGPSSTTLAQPVQVNHTMDSKNAETSVANTNNSNPMTGTNPTVVYNKNASYPSTSLNSKKPPLPSTQNGTAKPTTTPKAFGNTAVPDGTPNGSTKSASSIGSRPPTGIPHPSLSKPGATSQNIEPSRIPRPKNPSFGNKTGLVDEERSPPPSSQSEDEETNVGQPKTLFVEKKSIKGILKKKPSSASLPRKPESFGVRGEAPGKAGRSQRSMSAHARVQGPRDSVEVTKEHKLKVTKRRKKKMVRFTDLTYSNDTETDTDDEDNEYDVEEYDVYQNGDMQKAGETTAKRPPARPASAKVPHQSRVDSTTKGQRAISGGPQGKAAVGHQPHPPNEPPSGRATMKIGQSQKYESQNGRQVRSGGTSNAQQQQQQQQQQSRGEMSTGSNKGLMYSSGHDYMGVDRPGYTTTTTATNGNTAEKPSEAVYDTNGVRLDRTPTDDEINFLWDKVRTCLNREGSTMSSSGASGKKSEVNQYNNPHSIRQSQQSTSGKPQQAGTHSMNTKYIDGNSLAPQFRTQARVGPGGNRQPGIRKLNMDTLNSFSRRASLLNQRKTKEQNVTSIGYNQGENTGSKAVIQTSVKSLGYQQPVQSSNVPVHGGAQNGYHPDVTESMATFLAAEQMAGQSVSESEMEAAMQEAQAKHATISNGRPTNKIPSAISLEEQRLLQSLDRLNERLKVTETTDQHNVMHHGGFRGHAPLTNSNHPSKRFGSSNIPGSSSGGGFSRGQKTYSSSSAGSMYRPTTAVHYRTSHYQ